jgi:hypothetical protein
LAQSAKPNLSGTWQLDAGKSELHLAKTAAIIWQINETYNSIQMKQVETDDGGRERTVSFSCLIGGKECSFKEPGGSAKASFWYNGPMLVEMKTGHDDHIAKYRMTLGADGKTMDVELMAVVPPSAEKPDRLVFSKQQ